MPVQLECLLLVGALSSKKIMWSTLNYIFILNGVNYFQNRNEGLSLQFSYKVESILWFTAPTGTISVN